MAFGEDHDVSRTGTCTMANKIFKTRTEKESWLWDRWQIEAIPYWFPSGDPTVIVEEEELFQVKRTEYYIVDDDYDFLTDEECTCEFYWRPTKFEVAEKIYKRGLYAPNFYQLVNWYIDNQKFLITLTEDDVSDDMQAFFEKTLVDILVWADGTSLRRIGFYELPRLDGYKDTLIIMSQLLQIAPMLVFLFGMNTPQTILMISFVKRIIKEGIVEVERVLQRVPTFSTTDMALTFGTGIVKTSIDIRILYKCAEEVDDGALTTLLTRVLTPANEYRMRNSLIQAKYLLDHGQIPEGDFNLFRRNDYRARFKWPEDCVL